VSTANYFPSDPSYDVRNGVYLHCPGQPQDPCQISQLWEQFGQVGCSWMHGKH